MKILITGGSGTVGKAFIKKYRNKYEFVNINSSEINSVKLLRTFPEVKSYLGRVEDLGFLLKVFLDVKPDVVIHAAAAKHLDLAQKNPINACNINVVGSLNIIEASLRANVSITIAISTDKACSPTNVYGATKYLMEKCFLDSNTNDNKFSVTRFANIAHSAGSVLPFWLSLKKDKKPLLLTNPDMSRLMLTQDNAANTIYNVLEHTINNGGGIIGSHKSKSVNMYLLAKTISDDIRIVGNRGGEKVHEDLINEEEILYSYVEKDYIYLKNKQNNDKNTRLVESYTSLSAEKMSNKEMEKLIWE